MFKLFLFHFTELKHHDDVSSTLCLLWMSFLLKLIIIEVYFIFSYIHKPLLYTHIHTLGHSISATTTS